MQQRSTQQLLEQFYYDNYDSKEVDLNLYRQSESKLTSTYEKQPHHHIANLNNLNYLSSTHHTNYNTINQSSARDILYDLKQYERFANNENQNRQLNQFTFNNFVTDRHPPNNTLNGTNYSQNIINYNNSYYKINNINNYNCTKNQSSPTGSLPENYNPLQSSCNYEQTSKTKMERDDIFAEKSQLMKPSSDVANQQATIHNFSHTDNNTVRSHTIIPHPYNNIEDDENQDPNLHQQHEHNHRIQEQENQHSRHPIYRSQHFSQVRFSLRKFRRIQ